MVRCRGAETHVGCRGRVRDDDSGADGAEAAGDDLPGVRVGMGPRQMEYDATHRARHAHADLDEHETQAGDLGVRE